MEWLLLALVLGLLPAMIAASKGHNFFAWYVYGVLLFIVAIVHAIVVKPDAREIEREALAGGTLRKCPSCAELVKREAKVCKHCGRDLEPAPEPVWG